MTKINFGLRYERLRFEVHNLKFLNAVLRHPQQIPPFEMCIFGIYPIK